MDSHFFLRCHYRPKRRIFECCAFKNSPSRSISRTDAKLNPGTRIEPNAISLAIGIAGIPHRQRVREVQRSLFLCFFYFFRYFFITDLYRTPILTSTGNKNRIPIHTHQTPEETMASTSTLAIDLQQTDAPASHLRRAYEAQRMLFQAQPQAVQCFLEKQSLSLSQALVQGSVQVRFSLPEQLCCEGGNAGDMKRIPIDQREHRVGGLRVFLQHSTLPAASANGWRHSKHPRTVEWQPERD